MPQELNKEEIMFGIKGLESMQSYLKATWQLFLDGKKEDRGETKFYTFLKDRISGSITKLTNADGQHI